MLLLFKALSRRAIAAKSVNTIDNDGFVFENTFSMQVPPEYILTVLVIDTHAGSPGGLAGGEHY
ncbi:MAG: hypothetical protein HWE26_02430 [Alteromonadaceae bacterium]|nr:hypothetical protein [Alteromonadaceae bacterium]